MTLTWKPAASSSTGSVSDCVASTSSDAGRHGHDDQNQSEQDHAYLRRLADAGAPIAPRP